MFPALQKRYLYPAKQIPKSIPRLWILQATFITMFPLLSDKKKKKKILLDTEQNEHRPLKPFLVKIQEPNIPLKNNNLLLSSIGLTWPYVTLMSQNPRIQLSQKNCSGDGTTSHTCSLPPELHYGWASKSMGMNGDTPFRDTPFCFHLAGSTDNWFPSTLFPRK